MSDHRMHLPRTLPEITRILSGFKVKIDIRQMEQFVHKGVYMSAPIVDKIFGLVYNIVSGISFFNIFLATFFGIFFTLFCTVGGGEYGLFYLG